MSSQTEWIQILLDTIYQAAEALEDIDNGEEAAEAAYQILGAGIDKYLDNEQAQP